MFPTGFLVLHLPIRHLNHCLPIYFARFFCGSESWEPSWAPFPCPVWSAVSFTHTTMIYDTAVRHRAVEKKWHKWRCKNRIKTTTHCCLGMAFPTNELRSQHKTIATNHSRLILLLVQFFFLCLCVFSSHIRTPIAFTPAETARVLF